jgi:hypothetical protein
MTMAMAIPMADSITPGNLPPCPDYLVYVDGNWKTAGPVHAEHPTARLLTMTVLGGQAVADGCDCEAGDLTPAQAAAWAKRRLEAGAWRPVVYESASVMADVLAELAKLGVTRAQVRLLSAHYGIGEHICGPDVPRCGYPAADGTQWTSTYTGLGNSKIDMSALDDSFFGVVSSVTNLPITICGMYTDSAGDLFAVGVNKDGVLCESKRTAPGTWTTPYAIAGKTGA